MDSLPTAISARERAAALVIVLAFVVLFTVLVVAYLSRTTGDRLVAHGSFNQSKADQLAISAVNNIIGDVRQEITNGSTATAPNGVTIYSPTSAANMLPQQSGNPAGVPNLIRRSVRSDPILSPPAPTGGSLASAVNSAPVDPANPKRGEITLARWNKHYLIPKANTSDQKSDPVGTFTAPDWVFVTSDVTNQTAGRKVITSPDQSVIGRYAYAIYDEGGLVDMNVAGNPSPTPTPPAYVGRKGVLAFADLTALPTALTQSQVNSVVGWRNYATAQPG